jgi:hypothetical protein
VTQETIRCTLCPATMSYDGSGAAVKAMWNGRANNAVRGAAEPRTLDGLVGGTNREDKR